MLSTHGSLYKAFKNPGRKIVYRTPGGYNSPLESMTAHGITFAIVPHANSWKRINLPHHHGKWSVAGGHNA